MGQTQSGFVPHHDLDDELDQYGAELQLWAQPPLQAGRWRSLVVRMLIPHCFISSSSSPFSLGVEATADVACG